MAKVAKFDRQDVVNIATDLYWHKGFHATSMRNLQDHIDMRPGSIYAAFGSKDGLFKEALTNYARNTIKELRHYKDTHETPMAALIAFVKKQVIESAHNAPNGMCMLAKTLGELTEDNQALIDWTKSLLNDVTAEFILLIEQAQQQGEIDSNRHAEDLASHIQIQIAGLRTFAKMCDDPDKLNQMIDNIFSHYPF